MIRVLPICWAVVGATRISQVYDVRRPALVVRDVSIDAAVFPKESFQLGFVHPCYAKNGAIKAASDEEEAGLFVEESILANIPLVSIESPQSFHVRSILYRSHTWTVNPLDLCIDIMTIRYNPSTEDDREDESPTLHSSYFGHTVKAQESMDWHDTQQVSFEGCEAVFASSEFGTSANSTISLRTRRGKSDIRSTLGPMQQAKGAEDVIFEHVNGPLPGRMFELTRDMIVEAESQKRMSLSVKTLTDIANTCFEAQFLHNGALPALTSLIRTLTVPQWGNQLKVEEGYSLVNQATRLKGDYRGSDIHVAMRRLIGTMRNHNFALTGSPILFTVDAHIPKLGSDFEFYDHIGNVSTSHVASRPQDYLIELEPRYPVLGGWKFDWFLKYLVPADLYIRHRGTTQTLSVPWSAAVSSIWADEVLLEVVLPPLSQVTRVVSTHKEVASTQVTSTKRWFDLLTTRPILQLRWSDIPVLYTNPKIMLAQITYETRPFISSVLHLAWFPLIVAMIFGLVMIQPLIMKFFDFLVQMVNGSAMHQFSNDKKNA